MIEIHNLTHSLGGASILENISLNIPDGTVTGLVGVNGAGKSTLLRLLSGIYIPDGGKIEYDGKSPTLEETRRSLFFLPDDPYYTMQTTCKSMLEMYRPFYPELDVELYKSLMEKFKLDEKKPIRNFSKGMRRQAYIAIALAIRPKYLLLDEAFDGLDPLSRKRVKDELIRLVEEQGSTVIISSHSLRELEEFCDTYVLIDGKTVKSSGDITDKVGALCKFQLAFTDNIPEEEFRKLPVISLSRSGRFVTVVLEGDHNEMAERLSTLNPAVMEELQVDFEEAFIGEVGGEDEI